MKQALIYSLKVWLTSVLLGPAIYLILDGFVYPGGVGLAGGLGFIGYSIGYGLVLSIPCWLILFLLSGSLVNRKFRYKRTLITVVSTILSVAPFYLLFRGDDNGFDGDTLLWAFSYCAVIVAGVWLYRLEPKTEIEMAS